MKKVLLVTVVCLSLFFVCNYIYCQEEITLSTYYPAPYGEYRSLAVGDSYTAPAPPVDPVNDPDIDLVVKGRVGIGTETPGTNLDIEGFVDIGGVPTYVRNSDKAGDVPLVIFSQADTPNGFYQSERGDFLIGSTANNDCYGFRIVPSGTNNKTSFQIGTNLGTTGFKSNMTFFSDRPNSTGIDGWVGIGTTEPEAKFEVYDSHIWCGNTKLKNYALLVRDKSVGIGPIRDPRIDYDENGLVPDPFPDNDVLTVSHWYKKEGAPNCESAVYHDLVVKKANYLTRVGIGKRNPIAALDIATKYEAGNPHVMIGDAINITTNQGNWSMLSNNMKLTDVGGGGGGVTYLYSLIDSTKKRPTTTGIVMPYLEPWNTASSQKGALGIFVNEKGDGTNPASSSTPNWVTVFTEDGKVGIGTTNPGGNQSNGPSWEGCKLHLHNDKDNCPGFIELSGKGDNFQYSGIQMWSEERNYTSKNNWGIIHRRDRPGDLDFQFYEGSTDPDGDNYTHVLTLKPNGKVGIGTTNPTATLHVNGNIKYTGGELPDYVFEPNYELETIEDHAEFMWKEKRLKAIPKSEEENGKYTINIGAQNNGILEELEKAHIYIAQLNERLKTTNEELKTLKQRVAALEK